MKKLLTTLFALALVLQIFAQGWRPDEMEIKAFPQTQSDYQAIRTLHVSSEISNSFTLLYLTPKEFEEFQTFGINYEIKTADLNKASQEFLNSSTKDAYHTVDEILTIADGLIANYPDIVSNTIWGESVAGVPLYCLKISDNTATDENEAEIFFDAGIHGDEIGASENAIRFAIDLCEKYGTDPYVTELVNSREIFIYLMVNPDGRNNDVRYNENGVDLNREWDYMWWYEGNSPSPFSQPESQALRDCLLAHQFVVHTTYHSGTEYISCPWSYDSKTPPDADNILYLAGLYSSTSGYANIEYGQGATGMYQIYGASKDYNYGAAGSISWSMEISYDKHPAASQILQFYDYNYPAMLAMIEHGGYGVSGVVTDETTGDPVTASVWVGDKMMCFTDPTAGDFHKFVNPGTYDITVKANGYEAQTIANVTVTAEAVSNVDFELTPNGNQSAYRLTNVAIPDGNVGAPSETWNGIGEADGAFYSLGKGGYVVYDMLTLILDGSGNDIRIYEGDATPEGYEVFVSTDIDGNYVSIGTGTGTAEFDLNGNAAKYIRIEDDDDGSASASDAGFDLDAIEVMSSFSGPFISITATDYELEVGIPFTVELSCGNIGTDDAVNASALLTSSDSYVTINTTTAQALGNIAVGDDANCSFSITIDENTPAGYEIPFDVIFTGDNVDNSGFFSIEIPDYCIPEGTNCSSGDEIDDVIFVDISNLDSGCSPNGYGDFTDMSTDLEAGATYDFSVTCGYANEVVSAWIDFNGDSNFDDSERIVENLECTTSGQSYTISVVIPDDTEPITTRFRVRCNWQDNASSPCDVWTYGETEDYMVTVITDNIIADFTADNNTPCIGDVVQFTDQSIGAVTSWDWNFYGGDPATSTEQNPAIVYNTGGTFDVTLTVTGPNGSNTMNTMSYIFAYEVPVSPAMPMGKDTCITGLGLKELFKDTFNIEAVANAFIYEWLLEPTEAGTIVSDSLEGIVTWTEFYDGYAFISVKASNQECESDFSEKKEVFCHFTSGVETIENENVTIIPNPNGGSFSIQGIRSDGNNTEIRIYNNLGQSVYSNPIVKNGETLQLDLNSLESGIYFVELKSSNSRVIKKLIIQ